MQALNTLADYHLQRGAYAEAEHYARRQLMLESWSEEAHQQLMRILHASGQRSAALAQYGICRAALAAELDVPPLPTTTALYEEIRRGRGIPSHANAQHQALRNNLPHLPTSLIDRQAELDLLLHRLVNPAHRLTTLAGEGGVGKTRLALAVAQALVGCFVDGVWFVSLADLRTSDDEGHLQNEIAVAIAEAIGLALAEHKTPKEQLIAYLRSKEQLLILDNFEHLQSGAGLVHDLLRAAPNQALLVTTRQPLNFQAESVLRLTGLEAPVSVDVPTAAEYSAVALFAARACQRQPHFALTSTTLPAVVQICNLVRGLPLGIELAAAWVRQMTPAEIASGLTQSLDLLTSDQRDIPLRHRSMRAVFDQEQQIVVGATIFQGGFDRRAAASVMGATSALLADLTDKSLLQQDSDGQYSIHELLRQFATEKAHPHTQQGLEAAQRVLSQPAS